MKTKFKKNDQVKIATGKDKGKKGRILRINRETGKVLIEGLNMVKKTQRPKSQRDKGGIIEVEAPLAISNIRMICKKCGPTRIGMKIEDEKKKRVCRKCGEVL